MSKYLRLSEKWFNRGLWIISFIFASFLVGLGGSIVNDLPKVETHLTTEMFIDKTAITEIDTKLNPLLMEHNLANKSLKRLKQNLEDAVLRYNNLRDTYQNWLATRHVTQRVEQDEDLIKRTRELDQAKQVIDQLEQEIALKDITLNDLIAQIQELNKAQTILKDDARIILYKKIDQQDFRVFLYRLALTLPLLVIAGYLFAKKRKAQYWPFVWGFVFFAIFTFFVELVPYLPSYGGYVRYCVGIISISLIGYYTIRTLNRYLAQQKAAEASPERTRRKALTYDVALGRLSHGICPSCERKTSQQDEAVDFCPHCGINLYNTCPHCNTRKNAFSKFCFHCGTRAGKENQE